MPSNYYVPVKRKKSARVYKKSTLRSQVASIRRKVNVMAPEVKSHCREEGVLLIRTTPIHRDLTQIQTGTTLSTRVGGDVKLKSLTLRLNFYHADPYNSLRLIIVRYKGSGNAVNDTDFPNSTNPVFNYLACWGKNQKDKHYRIIEDRIITVDTYTPAKNMVLNYSLGYSKCSWDDAVNPSVPEDGGLMMFLVSDSGISTHPGFSYVSQVNYIDN